MGNLQLEYKSVRSEHAGWRSQGASAGAEGWESVARPWGRDAAQTWSENNLLLGLTVATRDASPEDCVL